ncbi:MAG: redoxin domain-containing protein [Planctomycetota bacterium]|nr:redoxin domain-containing protein [Planctomycetota bacterium]
MPHKLLILALALALVVPAYAEDGPVTDEKAPATAELGAKAPAITMQDTDGRTFDLHDNRISRKDAEAVVRAAAVAVGAAKDAGLDTKLADLKGLKDDEGAIDPSLVTKLALACGSFAGLTATEESAEAFKTLGDLVTWVAGANDAPIVLMTFAPKCPSVKKAAEKVMSAAAKSGVRIYAVACNTKDTDEDLAKFREAYDWNIRVFWDRQQQVTDVLGGKTTPHFFVFDSGGTLRYRGALDNDPMGFMDDADRKNYLLDAVTAIRGGKEVALTETAPSG